ncbi:TPA: TrbC/VirB2 family protein [Yersinia enterocolitica]|uniref:TrbC/VirB2 family protein n=1 Tax=Yersinia massiliensis TaxID=419257 RepID=UPI00156207A3|nr:TrbC/VirB2 family protein [Yersinia massiliensis]QKJ09283.1 TrbC/VirB2 family protein [Yersinia massiliensis]HDX9051773.1 TrbC/VirB2 family protein [Yersinia enterocolitica]
MSLLQKIKSLLSRPMAAMPLLAASPAFADGFSKANDLMGKISTGLHGVAAITITVAVVWVGYKVLWNGQSLKDCGNIIIGAILIISGAEFANLFVS